MSKQSEFCFHQLPTLQACSDLMVLLRLQFHVLGAAWGLSHGSDAYLDKLAESIRLVSACHVHNLF